MTGSMANWPFEIFDRLPLLYNTLSQYREDLEICFAAIGDAGVDRSPQHLAKHVLQHPDHVLLPLLVVPSRRLAHLCSRRARRRSRSRSRRRSASGSR